MDRLIYTNLKNSGKSKKLKIGKKELEINSGKLLMYLKALVIGAIMGIGAFMVLISTFGLSYSAGKAFSGGFKGSFIETYNSIAATLAERCGIFADQLVGGSGNCGLFLTFVLVVLIVVSVLIEVSGNRWYAFVYVAFAVIPLVAWGLGGTVLSYSVLALGIMLFVADGTLRRNNYGAMIYVLAMCVAAFVLLSVPVIAHLAEKPDALGNYSESKQQAIADSYYGTNVLHNGYLRDSKREKGKGVALKVIMEQPQSMYLRGFVGDILSEDGWEPLDNSVYYENRNLIYWLDQSGFNGIGQLQQSSELANLGGKKKLNSAYVQETGRITVKNEGADSRYAYIPYEITGDKLSGMDGSLIESQNYGDSFIKGGWRNRLQEYCYESAGNLTSSWTETAARYFSNNAVDPSQEQYELSESHYNSFVYDNFLYISSDDRKILDEKIGNSGIQKRGHVEYNTAVSNVKSIMAGLFTYSRKIKYKDSKSAFENIMTTYKGYDAQYATAAVMLFRYYGIPARYVEGYFITTDDVIDGGRTVDVKAARNHAWAEIYVDRIGFVPVEVCPEYEGLMEEADYTIGISNKTKKKTLDNSDQNDENPNGGAGAFGGQNDKKVPSKVLIVLGIIAGLMVIGAIVLAFLIIIKKIRMLLKRRKLFLKGDPKEASCAIYKRMEDLKLDVDEEAMDIGNRAAYSTHLISEKERQTMLKKLKQFKQNSKKKEKQNKKIKLGKNK